MIKKEPLNIQIRLNKVALTIFSLRSLLVKDGHSHLILLVSSVLLFRKLLVNL